MTHGGIGRALVGLLILVALVSAPATAAAQQEELPINDVDTGDYPTVTVDFNAPPAFVSAELTGDEVTVTENGVPVDFTISRTQTENLEVVLVVDTSGSMSGAPLTEAKLAASGFVDRLPPDSRIAVVGFGDQPEILNGFTSNQDEVREAIDRLQSVGETSLYDAILVAVRLFGPDPVGPRSVVLVTDGGDTVSVGTLGSARAALQATGIPLFAVSLVTSESDPESLSALVGESGGALVEATDPVGLAELYDSIATALTVQYQVQYESDAEGRTAIQVELARDDATATGAIEVSFPISLTVQPTVEPTAVPATAPTAVPVTSEPRTLTVETPQNTWLLPVGIAIFAVALIVLFNVMLWPSRKRGRVLKDVVPVAGAAVRSSGNILSGLAAAILRWAERLVAKRDDDGHLANRLDRAGIRMRPAEFLVTTLSAAIVAALLGFLLNRTAGVILALLVAGVSYTVVGIIGDRRARAFEQQMPSTLQMMGGALRSGFSISQVVDLVAREASSPTRDEFARLAVEESLGRDISDSFRDVAVRMKSEDFAWVAEAIDINRAVGGDLSEVLENVSETIRTRQNIQREIRTLSAEGRLSAAILISVPFLISAGQFAINPELANELTGTGEGRVLIGIGLVMISVGAVWMKRITRLKY